MKRLIERGYRAKTRPSGHVITAKFQRDHGGSIPSNLIERGNNECNSAYIKACAAAGVMPHPARSPAALPQFFVKLLAERGESFSISLEAIRRARLLKISAAGGSHSSSIPAM